MGEKTVRFSDLSGRVLGDGDDVTTLVVLEHPDLPGGPVRLEALPDELRPVDESCLSVVVFEVRLSDGSTQPVVMETDDFNALATDKPMGELLKTAPRMPGKRVTKGVRAARPVIDYATLDHAGTSHRGKVTHGEARIVREHLAEVNARLAAQGQRVIDPGNPEHALRYGLTQPAPEREPVQPL